MLRQLITISLQGMNMQKNLKRDQNLALRGFMNFRALIMNKGLVVNFGSALEIHLSATLVDNTAQSILCLSWGVGEDPDPY